MNTGNIRERNPLLHSHQSTNQSKQLPTCTEWVGQSINQSIAWCLRWLVNRSTNQTIDRLSIALIILPSNERGTIFNQYFLRTNDHSWASFFPVHILGMVKPNSFLLRHTLRSGPWPTFPGCSAQRSQHVPTPPASQSRSPMQQNGHALAKSSVKADSRSLNSGIAAHERMEERGFLKSSSDITDTPIGLLSRLCRFNKVKCPIISNIGNYEQLETKFSGLKLSFWSICRLIDRLIDWLIAWAFLWLIDWLIER